MKPDYIKAMQIRKQTKDACAYLLSLSTKSGPSAEGDVEQFRRISESESCCKDRVILFQLGFLHQQEYIKVSSENMKT